MSNKIDAQNYVVLDVETNGLSSIRDDLLSIYPSLTVAL